MSEPETFSTAYTRLNRVRAGDISDQGIVLKTALEFALAIGRGDGSRAGELVDAVGYQALPITGELPENPARPILRDDLSKTVQSRPAARFESLPFSCLEVLDAKAVREQFPAVADWMLPEDFAVALDPVPGQAQWVQHRCCLVVRLRARHPSVQGGSLLEALGG